MLHPPPPPEIGANSTPRWIERVPSSSLRTATAQRGKTLICLMSYDKDFLFVLLYTVNSHRKAKVRLPTCFDLRCSRFEFVPVPAPFEQKLGVHPRVCCPRYIRCDEKFNQKFNQLFSALMRFASPLIHSAQLMCL